MQAQRLAVCGWDESVPSLLAALEASQAFRATRVVDHGTSALVRARQATGLPCALHPAAALRDTEVDAVLLAAPGHAAAAVDAARRRHTTLIVAPEALDPASILLAAEGAVQDSLTLATLRPVYRASGLASVVDGGRGRSIEALTLELAGDEPRMLLHAAVVAALRLLPGMPEHVVASAWGSPCARGGITVTLRYNDGRLATLDVRRGELATLRVVAESLAGPVPLRRQRDGSGDALAHEASRAALVTRPNLMEAMLLQSEAAVLLAIDAALETGEIVTTERLSRASLHVITRPEEAPALARAQGIRTRNLRLVLS
ncbi:MAG: hypothetical protein Q7K37_00695 [Dehalococcoidia bacterium]|nr:hypothetical protein [Dehalococcoidia bacterium]